MLAHVASILLAFATAATALTISTPAISQCQDVTFDIGGAGEKVWFTVLPAENSCESEAIFEAEVTVVDGKYTWIRPEIPAGSNIVILIDNNGTEEAWSAPIIVGGSADACNAATSPSSSSTNTAPAANTNRPTINSNGGSNVDTPENAAEAPEDTSAAMTVKAQVSVTALLALAGVAAVFA